MLHFDNIWTAILSAWDKVLVPYLKGLTTPFDNFTAYKSLLYVAIGKNLWMVHAKLRQKHCIEEKACLWKREGQFIINEEKASLWRAGNKGLQIKKVDSHQWHLGNQWYQSDMF